MAKHLRSTMGAVVLAVLPSLLSGQAPARISVSYQSAPVADVVASFARFAHQTIVVAPEVGDQSITGEVVNGEWLPALDQLLAAQGLVARPDSGGVLRVQAEEPISVEYANAPLRAVLRAISSHARRQITVAPDVGDPAVSFVVRSTDWQRALDVMLRDNGLTSTADVNGNIRVVRQ